jgi:hypothetical protein
MMISGMALGDGNLSEPDGYLLSKCSSLGEEFKLFPKGVRFSEKLLVTYLFGDLGMA